MAWSSAIEAVSGVFTRIWDALVERRAAQEERALLTELETLQRAISDEKHQVSRGESNGRSLGPLLSQLTKLRDRAATLRARRTVRRD